MNANVDDSYTLKIIFVGDRGVGKSAIIASIINGTTTLPEHMTIFMKDFFKNDGTHVFIQFWDSIIQEQNNNQNIFFIRSSAAVVVFDITNRNSFAKLDEIINKIRENADPSITLIIVGNKIDLNNRVISTEEAEKYAGTVGANYIEVSALSRQGINNLIDLMLHRIPRPPQNNNIHLEDRPPLKANFCTRTICGAYDS